MTPSRRHLFALLGLVLPVAAFTAAPVSAETSAPAHHKSRTHHAVSHKAKPHHASVHHASHRTAHRAAPKTSAS